MSAFVVSQNHINAIVNYANKVLSKWDSTYSDPQAIGQILLDENIRSVSHRYAHHGPEPAQKFRWKLADKTVSAVQMLKLLSCLHYQSCETEDFDSTKAAKLIRDMTSNTIADLPGYEEAEWALD